MPAMYYQVMSMSKLVQCPYCTRQFSEHGIGTHIWRKQGAGVDFDPNRGYKTGERATFGM